MNDKKNRADDVIRFLWEREKELECLYRIEELLVKPDITPDDAYRGIVEAVPTGWQYPEVCRARITIGTDTYQAPDFTETPWRLTADIMIQNKKAGEINFFYKREMPSADAGPFLK